MVLRLDAFLARRIPRCQTPKDFEHFSMRWRILAPLHTSVIARFDPCLPAAAMSVNGYLAASTICRLTKRFKV